MWAQTRLDEDGDGVIEVYPPFGVDADAKKKPDMSVSVSIMMGSVFEWAKGAPKRADPRVEILVSGGVRMTPAQARYVAEAINLSAKIADAWMRLRKTHAIHGAKKWLRLLQSTIHFPPSLP